MYVDASHASNKVTRRGHTGFIIFLNWAPLIWYSKRQNNVEEITFSSDFLSDKVCVEHITVLYFKFCMLGIPVVDSTKILCDNASVVKNSSILSSTLNKKYISIAYHIMRWHLTAGVIKFVWIDTNATSENAMTNRLTSKKVGNLFGYWNY